jgi:DmsE family decaheme c-type cytochrome
MRTNDSLTRLIKATAITSFFLLLTVGIFLIDGVGAKSTTTDFGSQCAECHEDTVNAFGINVHSHMADYGVKGDCSSCHAGAAEHIESGDPEDITNLANVDSAKASAACLECHSKDKNSMFWLGSEHDANGLNCMDCHNLHGEEAKLLKEGKQKDLCFTCHMDVRATMMKRSSHPVSDSHVGGGEKMTCSSCHNAHGARSESMVDAKSINDKCYECHVEKKAPVLHEHFPVKEDCLNCHNSHGSSNDKLLVTKIPRLCQECHIQGRHQSQALPENSAMTFNKGCLNCHPQIHGSNSPSGVVLQR